MFLKFFSKAIRAVLKVPEVIICWDLQDTFPFQTHAVSDYHGVININQEGILWRRNIKICTLLYKQTICPQQQSTLGKAHTLLALFQGQEPVTQSLHMTSLKYGFPFNMLFS